MTAASCFPPTFPHPARNIIRPNTGSSSGTLPEYLRLWHLPASPFTFLGTTDLYSLRLAGVQGTARIYVDGRLLSDIGFTSSLKASSETEKGQPVYRISARHYAADP